MVEGDSAGGSAKQARDRITQAIMPLRGKILNTWEVETTEILASQEVHDISVAIGVDPVNQNIEDLRYHKICILADADSDGLHIATLICALFLRHYRNLVEAGHIYIAMPPLFRIDAGKKVSSKCTACHGFNSGGGNRIGPNLWAILGKAKAEAAGFNYSDALKGLGGVWSVEDMNLWLKSPKKYAPGNSMAFVGLRKDKDRANLLAYLNSMSDSPIELTRSN